MANAHCICPKFLEAHIKDPLTYTNVFVGQFLESPDQIVFDHQEVLASEYLNSVKDDQDAFQNYNVWKKLLDAQPQGKTLISNAHCTSSSFETVFNTINSAITRHDKAIVTCDNNHYGPFIGKIQSNGINLLNLNNLNCRPIQVPNQRIIGHTNFENDLDWVLERTGRTCRKKYSEDDDNDHVRDLLDAKGYSVRDQTREGRSASGKSSGELDILIENCGHLYTVIEAMKLSTMKESYIDEHYLKLTTNYNPMSVKRTYLVTYYTGKNFADWWRKYVDYISTLAPSKISSRTDTKNLSTEEADTKLHGLKKLYNHISIAGELSTCVHYAVRIET